MRTQCTQYLKLHAHVIYARMRNNTTNTQYTHSCMHVWKLIFNYTCMHAYMHNGYNITYKSVSVYIHVHAYIYHNM